MGIPTKPPTFRTIDWGAEVRRIAGDDWHKKDTGYEFADTAGRPLRRFDDGTSLYLGTGT